LVSGFLFQVTSDEKLETNNLVKQAQENFAQEKSGNLLRGSTGSRLQPVSKKTLSASPESLRLPVMAEI
jgi:hypothetical protein